MSKKSIFDSAMDYIDEHIELDNVQLKRGLYAATNYTDADFNRYIVLSTDGKMALGKYIQNRKLFFAAMDLQQNLDLSISDIAQKYGYSDQSALNRAIKRLYGYTPSYIRKERPSISDNRLNEEELRTKNDVLSRVLTKFCSDEPSSISQFESDYFASFLRATEECGFDIGTCSLISELASRLHVPFGKLIIVCFDAMIDSQLYDECYSPEAEVAMELGITSDEEAACICQHFGCDSIFELNIFMVEAYRRGQSLP